MQSARPLDPANSHRPQQPPLSPAPPPKFSPPGRAHPLQLYAWIELGIGACALLALFGYYLERIGQTPGLYYANMDGFKDNLSHIACISPELSRAGNHMIM